MKRGNFSQVTDTDVAHFQSILENSRVLLDESDTQSYNIDFMKSVRGNLIGLTVKEFFKKTHFLDA